MLIKTEVKYKNIAELFTYLVAGYVLRNGDTWGTEIKIVDGVLLLDGIPSSLDAPVSFWGNMYKDGYRLYKDVQWYEPVPKTGMMCWVSDYDADLNQYNPEVSLEIITRCDKSITDYRFRIRNNVGFRYARPVLKEEIIKYTFWGL